jgi:thiazole synthase ThiGH ThiG subunit
MLELANTRTPTDAIESIESSGCEIVTVAIRRLPTDLKMIIQTFK